MIHINVTEEQLNRCKSEYFKWLECLFHPAGSVQRINDIIDYFDLEIPSHTQYDLRVIEDRRNFLIENKKEIINKAFSQELNHRNYTSVKVNFNNIINYSLLKFKNKSKSNYSDNLYNFFRKSELPFKIYKDILGINVCPYCNKNSLEYIEENNALQSRMDIDHIKPKSNNPNLAIHFFNLMPSCHTCNFIKKESEYKSLFNIQNTDFKFEIDYTNMDYGDIAKFHLSEDIKIKIIRKDKIKDTLKLEKRYINDKPKIKKILERQYWYNENYLTLLKKTLDSALNNTNENELKVYELLELHYDERHYFYTPYSKLTKELLEHIESITEKYK